MTAARQHVVVVGLPDVDRTWLAIVGGKGAHLGELARLSGVQVPAGFCVTAHAYERVVAVASIDDLLERLSAVRPNDREAISSISAEIRVAIEQAAIPVDVSSAITDELSALGEAGAYAVRSSATAEDLAGASFAGQYDTYLNLVGSAAVLEHVRRCWASLFSERAVTYRAQSRVDHRAVRMAVVVQQMVDADAAGVMFTADPISSNRRITLIESTYGLGEALVSGRVDTDVHRVRGGEILETRIGIKQTMVGPAVAGGTHDRPVDDDRRHQPVLRDEQVLTLARLGRRIEEHFGFPQDIEWCLTDGDFQIVQSRPITTLFPIPPVDDDLNHVYVSVGHNQMMTDAMKPLGLSFWQMTTPAPMTEVAGRLFVDVTARLASAAGRSALMALFGRGDPLLADALENVIARDGVPVGAAGDHAPPPMVLGNAVDPIPTDPMIVTSLIAQTQASIDLVSRAIRDRTGTDLFDFIAEDIGELRAQLSGPLTHKAAMAGMEATWWLNDHIADWLGDRTVVDTLTRSAPGNVTSEMGLALLDVADVIRPCPQVVAYLESVDTDDDFLDHLDDLGGGPEARAAIESYLDRYGMRCSGEIDITRPRWAEQPGALVPAIIANTRNFEPGERQRRFERGRRLAEATERELLQRLRVLPDGDRKAGDAKQMIDRLRTFIGFREYPKYGMSSRYYIYKQALLREADRLVHADVLREREDIFWLRFEELREVVRNGTVDQALIEERKVAQQHYEVLTPPRVLTTSAGGEIGAYRRDHVPSDALVGLAVSAGTVEGRARVITAMADADLQPGDILITTHTDPSWSPLFVTIAGLVTEVGGLMTHGAVVAREYGLPAVVGVEHATRRIRDGQRIRLNGTDGYVEYLDEEPEAR